jgi:hypothetical protein
MNRDNIDFNKIKELNLLKKKNVESYFDGIKQIKGNSTGELCIIVGVCKKEPKGSLLEEDLIPSEINGVKTDVIEVPKMIASDYCGSNAGSSSPSQIHAKGCGGHTYNSDGSPFECIPGGISIGPKDTNSAGTLGLSVQDSDGSIIGLTNNHVVGPQIYYAKDDSPTEYEVNWVLSSSGNIYTFFDSESQDLYFNPSFDGSLGNLPKLDVGKKYIFKTSTYLIDHPFSISTNAIGGPSNRGEAVTSVVIKNANGVTIYEDGFSRNGSGRNYPYASSGEILEFEYNSNTFSSQFYFQCWNHENMGGKLDLVFSGVPYCLSSNRESTTSEYSDGILLNSNKDIRGSKVVTPSNIDVNGNGGSGQKEIGFVKKSSSLKFNHPQNSSSIGNHGENPSNKIDAAVISFETSSVPHNKIQSLFSGALSSAPAATGKNVYKSGRTTGVTPSGGINSANKSVILSASWSGNVYYCPSDYIHNDGTRNSVSSVQHVAQFEDCVLYLCNGEWFSDAGDSGSAVFIEENSGESLKVMGLHFAGATSTDPIKSYGIACKMENVFSELSLSSWSGERSISEEYLLGDQALKICDECYVVSDNQSNNIGKYEPQSQPTTYSDGDSCKDS